ncbi:MAG: Fic family protein [Gammaproteobacteria bacterium]
MSQNTKKMAVLKILKQHSPLTLAAILEILGPGFAERTVRRWLSEMVHEGTVLKTGAKRSTHYQALASLQPPIFTEQAIEAIHYIRQPIFMRKPVAYSKEWLNEYQPNKTFYLPTQVREHLHTQGQRSGDKNTAGTYARKIYNKLLIDLSYNSSRLEGNTYSLLDTERLILEGTSAEGKLDEEKIMILNHKEAIRHLIDMAPKIKVDFNEICTLHFLLSDGLVSPQYSGKIRDHGVRIGGSTYVPLENKIELENQLNKLSEIAYQIQDPFEQSLFLLTHIAYLQAFTDVNKRTSRLSANISLIKHNLVPLSFNDINKDDYNSAMICIYELNDVKPLADLYYFSYLRSCQHYDVTSEAIGYDEVRVRYRQYRREIIRFIIANKLIGKKLDDYVQEQTNKAIPEIDRQRFLITVTEDLAEINVQRIAGLGITTEQLKAWLNKKKG